MSLAAKVKAVEEIFEKLDTEIASLQSWSGLHCKMGCGKCCFKPDIEATILEFLPFAFHLNQMKIAEEWLGKLADTNPALCPILNPTQSGAGLCSDYQYRGLICRLFGYSARTNKYDQRELITCQIIKSEQPENFKLAEQKIKEGEPVPVMNQYYMQLHAIDFELTNQFYPIKIAIRKAIEVVLHYYSYR
jgi:Fe-S-cluster containining protein